MSEEAFDPAGFLRVADTVAGDNPDEAAYRTAVGRAYYAVFLMARVPAGIEGRHQAHERVCTTFSPANHRLASLLRTLASLRIVADYELVPPQHFRDWRVNWVNARRLADEIVDELAKLS